MYTKSALAWTIAVLLFTTSNALSIGEDGKETGDIALSEEQYRESIYGKVGSLPAVKLEEHEYSALQSDIDRSGIKLLATCSTLYKQFMNKYGSTFQSWANKNCQDYTGVWCCPSGGCTFFIFRPYVLCNWRGPIYIPKIPVWEWPQVEVPGEEIIAV
jgi:hypothetical protein